MGRQGVALFALAFLILLPGVVAHHAAGNGVKVRVENYDPKTSEYTISCDIPPGVDTRRYYAIDPIPQGQNEFYRTYNRTFVWKLNPVNYTELNHPRTAMYHLYCEVQNYSAPLGKQNLAAEFHIDLRTQANEGMPNIYVLNSSGPSVTLKCEPPYGTTRYTLSWNLRNRESRTSFPELNNHNSITLTLPHVSGGWDVTCTVTDHDKGITTYWDMPIEIFGSGPAYIPTIEGCVPGEPCTWVHPSGIPPAGTLHIQANPLADVYLNEVHQGSTSAAGTFMLSGITPGIYNLVLRKSGFDELSTLAPIASGKTLSRTYALRASNANGSTTPPSGGSGGSGNSSSPPQTVAQANATCTDRTLGQSCLLVTETNMGSCRTVSWAEPGQSSVGIRAQACQKSGNVVEVARQVYSSGHDLEACFFGVCVDKDWGFRQGTIPSEPLNESNATQPPIHNSSQRFEQTDFPRGDRFDAALNLMQLQGLTATFLCDHNGGTRYNIDWFGGKANEPTSLIAVDVPSRWLNYTFASEGNYSITCGVWSDVLTAYTADAKTVSIRQPENLPSAPPPQQSPVSGVGCVDRTISEPCVQLSDISAGSCRTVSWAEPGQSSVGIRAQACQKSGNVVEVARQVYSSGHDLEACFFGICVDRWWGFRAGTSQGNEPEPEPEQPEEEGSEPDALMPGQPVWIEPTNGLTNVAPNYFHLAVQQPADAAAQAAHFSTDWEVWNTNLIERVWIAHNITGTEKYHAHTPDGNFENSLLGASQLSYGTSYSVRARFKNSQGAFGPWAQWRTFTTRDAPVNSTSNQRWTAAPGFRVERFATGFDVPVHVAAAPQELYQHLPQSQRPFLYVTELYGTLKVVHRDGRQSVYAQNLLNFDPFGSITGGGQMGLVGLYVEPQSGDLFVGMTYVEGGVVKNKVERFFTSDDGLTYTGRQVIVDNLPSAPSHQVQQITRGPDGKLYVNLGDSDRTTYPQDDARLAGKIIRMNSDGSNLEIYAKGFRNPFGADWRPGFNQLFVTDNAPDSGDRLLKVDQGGNYGWCCSFPKGIFTLNVSPVDVEFNQGSSGFPSSLSGRMYVAVSGAIYQRGQTNGKHILEFTLDSAGNVTGAREFVKYTGNGYGTPVGLDFASDGLYFTDIYGEPGFVGVGKTEGNIYRVVEGDPLPCEDCAGPFRAGISVVPWYPKDTGRGIEYIFECQGIDGSGSYRYDFSFGDGERMFNTPSPRQYHHYPYGDRDYAVSCTVKDQTSGLSISASTTVNPDDFIYGR